MRCLRTALLIFSGLILLPGWSLSSDKNPTKRESDVRTYSQRRCDPGYWQCRSGQCIPETFRCNRRYDCIDYSDEDRCRPDTRQPQPDPRQQPDPRHRQPDPRQRQPDPRQRQPDPRRRQPDPRQPQPDPRQRQPEVRVVVSPDRQSVRAGQSITIYCQATGGVDQRSLRWTKVGGPLPRSASERDGRLTITSIQHDDSGTYVCTARHERSQSEGRATVTVLAQAPLEQRGRPRCDPRTQKTCQDGSCVENARVCDGVPDCADRSDELNCAGQPSLDCQPNEMKCNNGRCIQKMWICDGDDDCNDRTDEASCAPKRAGDRCESFEYECQNKRQCIPKSFHCDGENDCQDGSDEIGCIKPTVTEPPPAQLKVTEGETIILKCRAIGMPPPHISWRKNWGHVCPPPRCTQTSEGGFGVLTIRNAVSGDSGAYTCEALNVRGRILAVPDCIVEVGTTNLCNKAGTLTRTPDGHCQCKAFVVGKTCDQCQPHSFWLNAANPQGCLRCFCSGVTQECSSSSWYRTQVRYTLTSSDANAVKFTNAQGHPQISSGVQISPRSEITYQQPIRTTTYISLPQTFLGDQITAYGGDLKYTISFSGGGSPNTDAAVILKGNEIVLLHKTKQRLYPDRPNTVVVPMYETSFQREDGQPCTREHLLMTLADLESLQIKVTYLNGQSSFSLSEVSLDVAADRDTQQEIASAVEQCRCPEGYVGLSCEDCAPNYKRSGGGLYLGTCEKDIGEPECNPFGTLRTAPDGSCVCKKNVIGKKCDICTPPTFFLDARNPHGCIDCFCSGVAETCESSDYYRIQISKDFGREGPTGLQIRTKDMDNPTRPRGTPRRGNGQVVFDSFGDAPSGKALYWELPNYFHGDRVTAYGGGIKYKLSFSGSGAENREPDVVIRGNNVVLYYYHWAGVEPDMDQLVTVNMYESNWRQPDGIQATRPQLMMALSDLDTILLKLSYRDAMTTAALSKISMDISKTGRTDQERALAVEVCDCPAGYTGSSCEDCAPRYFRNKRGNEYLGTCQGGPPPATPPPVRRCPFCSGHSDNCNAQTRECYNCQHNTFGPRCDQCKPSFYGDARRGTPNDCQQCPCPPGVSCSLAPDRQVRCDCPPGYTGQRCEQCSGGYTKDPSDPRVCRPVVQQPIQILQGPELRIAIGANAEITCTTPGSQVDHVRWVRLPGGRPVPHHWDQPAMGRLEVRSFQPQDAGDYECQAYNRAGSVVGRAQIRLVAEQRRPTTGVVTIEGKGVKIVRQGDTFELRCSSPNPQVQVRWFRIENGRPVSPRGQDNRGILRVSNAQSTDAGEYRCISYVGGREGGTKNIYVIVQSSEAVDQPFKIGVEAELRCPVLDVPGMSVTWSRTDGDPLPRGSIQDGAVLRIPNFSSQHEGRYECRVEIEQEFAFGYIQCSVEDGDVLYVEIHSSKSVVAIGDTVTFTCNVMGDPNARIEWTKAADVLSPSANVQSNRLTIRVNDATDGGVYRCTAYARGNTRLTSEAILTIGDSKGAISGTYPPVQPGGELQFGGSAKREIITHPGGDVVLVCPGEVADGIVASEINWNKFNGDIPYGATKTEQGTLVIPDVTKDVAGVYGCHIATREGYSLYVNVTLKVGDYIPEFQGAEYIVLNPLPEKSKEEYKITVSFRPTAESGLILYSGSGGDFVSFGIEEGKPLYRFNLGGETTELRATKPVTLNEWHTAQISRTGKDGALDVDHGKEQVTATAAGDETELTPGSEVLIGGGDFSGDPNLASATSIGQPFYGCVSQIDYGDGPVELATVVIREEGTIQQCPVCKAGQCNNQGECTPSGQSAEGFKCDCKEGFFGQRCDSTQPVPEPEPETEPPTETTTESAVETTTTEPVTTTVVTEPIVDDDTTTTEEIIDIVDDDETTEATTTSETDHEEGSGTDVDIITTEPPIIIDGPTTDECTGPNGETCNGGRCLVTGDEFKCVCKVGTKGEGCNEDVQYGGYVQFDTPQSFVALPKPESSDFEAQFRVKLESLDDAVLLYAPGEEGYVSVVVADEKLEMRFDNGNGMVPVKQDAKLRTGEWYTVTIKKDGQDGSMDTTSEFGGPSSASGSGDPNGELTLTGPLFIGGVAPETEVHDDVKPKASIKGTFERTMTVDDKEYDLIKDAVDGGDVVSGESGSPCDANVCGEDGTCIEEEGDRKFKCECPENKSGPRCEQDEVNVVTMVPTDGDPCEGKPCGEHGKCEITSESTYECMCQVGFTGLNCDQFSPVEKSAMFDSKNFAEFDKEYLPHMSSEEEEVIEIKLKTKAENGLVLWHGQQKNEAGAAEDYLAVGLSDGFLEFKYDLGGGPSQIVSNEKINDGEVHNVKLIRTGKEGQLIVDDGEAVTGSSQGILAMLNTDGNIFVGGVPDLELMTNGAYEQNFVGCILNLKLKDRQMDFMEDSVGGRDVSKPCTDDEIGVTEADEEDEGDEDEETLSHSGVIIRRLRRGHFRNYNNNN